MTTRTNIPGILVFGKFYGHCQFPECCNFLKNASPRTKYCHNCGVEVNKIQAKRRYNERTRSLNKNS
jgi:ssDNA-binding Zn-finger/Zn-ribbon topoisomerase 1